jgi:hypothetical protein
MQQTDRESFNAFTSHLERWHPGIRFSRNEVLADDEATSTQVQAQSWRVGGVLLAQKKLYVVRAACEAIEYHVHKALFQGWDSSRACADGRIT